VVAGGGCDTKRAVQPQKLLPKGTKGRARVLSRSRWGRRTRGFVAMTALWLGLEWVGHSWEA
jgi:hypothetical protein